MQLLYISTFMFHTENGRTWALPSCTDAFFEKYLDVFDSVRVLGEEVKSYLDRSALVEMQNTNIGVRILPANTHPIDFKNDGILKKQLENEMAHAEAILIKPATRRGIMAIKIAERLKKPYMIEMTGDIHNALLQHPNPARRIYAPILYRQIKKAISSCRFALYVSEHYLQKKYPIKGTMCGCTDVVLEKSNQQVLEQRLQKISMMHTQDTVQIALIGFYQGNGKGVDTALRALAQLPENYHLSVLGNGTEESRRKWYAYGQQFGVKPERLHFPAPLSTVQEVLSWLDDFDFFVAPTRSEGFSRAIVEAMSRGMTCLGTNICTLPECLPEECLFELDDDKKLAELIMFYYNNPELMQKLAVMNFEKVKEYDEELLRTRRNNFLQAFKDFCVEKNGKMLL